MFNGTNMDAFVGTPAIGSGSANFTTSYVAGLARTAPNTTNYITGCLFFISQVPTSSGDVQVEVRESGVSKVSGVALNADLKLGFNYVRFATPYKFTTTAAGAYVPYIRKVTSASGSYGYDNAGSMPFLALTYDATSSAGGTDDVMVCGFHDSGMTPKTLTITGTGNSWGSGQNKALTSSSRVLNQATCVANGGIVKFDTAADTTLTQYGNVWVSAGGLYDQRPGASSVSTLVFTNDADGDFSLATFNSTYGGQILTTGRTVAVAATYNGGLGTAASPATFTAAHGFSVGDELVIGWGTDYLKNEVRFVISVPNPDEVVWSTTAGGSEAALTYTHATGYPVANLTRNSIITATDTAKGYSVYNFSTNGTVADFRYTRFEHPNCLSGRGLQLSSTASETEVDGMVLYNNSASGRSSISCGGSIPETWQDIVLFNTKGSNFSAQSGLVLGGASRKTLRRIYHYAEPGSTTCCAGVSINAASTGNAVDGFYSSGANAANSAGGYALGVYGSGNTLNDVVVDGARRQAVILDAGQLNEFTNSRFGQVATNTIDVAVTTGVLCAANFIDCSFGSATLLSNYLNLLAGSDIGFQNMDGNQGKHRWFTNTGSFWSAGAGLADTTVRTPGSLSLAIKPESTDGNALLMKVPANPTSQVVFYGYLYRNATFSSGDITVELFLPGTLLTDTPDASYTLPTTTDEWLPFTVAAYYAGTEARYATVRITAKTATAGAYCFLDDIYDAGTGNKVAGLDLWDAGHISPIIVAADYSSIPEQTRVAVWSDDAAYTVGSKGRSLADTEQNTDVTQAKVDML